MIGIALVIGLSATAGIVKLAWNSTLDHEKGIFNTEAAAISGAINRKLNTVEESLQATKSLFDASESVDADEFRVISDNILSRHDYIVAIAYAPVVKKEMREEFEKSRSDEGYFGYHIKEVKQSVLEPSIEKPFYLPILFLEPFEPETARFLGADLLSITDYESFILSAVDNAHTESAMPDVFFSFPFGYSIFLPTYAGRSMPELQQDRRNSFNGVIAMRIASDNLISGIDIDEHTSLTLKMIHPEHETTDHVVFEDKQKHLDAEDEFGMKTYKLKNHIKIGNQNYMLTVEKNIDWEDIDNWFILFSLLTGLVVTALLVFLARANVLHSEELKKRNEEIGELVKHRTQELVSQKERAQTTLHSIADGVVITDAMGHIESINPVAEKLSGWSEKEVQGKPIASVFIVIESETREKVENTVLQSLQEGRPISHWGKFLLLNRMGSETPIDESSSPIFARDRTISGAVLVIHDVSHARELSQKMAHQATHDTLTGLPNRALLMDRLNQVLSRAPWNTSKNKVLAVMFLDLDRFKLVNDTLGHDVGDQLIIQVGERLQGCLRDGDTVCRLGGDEFVLLLKELAIKEDVVKVAEKVINEFSKPFRLSSMEFYTTASIGISMFPENGQDEVILMKNADTAMYRAKAAGKNNYKFYSDDMNEQSTVRLSLESSLRKAIDRDELRLFYQPQIDTISGQVIGAEALLRWEHPDHGLIPPMEFIPLAEETGLIVPIGEWVITEACRQNKAWHDAGLAPIRIAVNIADAQFQKPNLIRDIKLALRKSGLSAEYLELEMTEGILARNADAAIATLTELKKMGINVSIDDFGTGYSSLSYLKRFPVDTLKVDRAFVRDIMTDKDDATICATIISMAKHLNLTVIAEGVEDIEQLQFLSELGCEYIQGFYFSPPVPAEKFTEILSVKDIYTAQLIDQ